MEIFELIGAERLKSNFAQGFSNWLYHEREK